MALINFLNQTARIFEKTISIIGGEETIVENDIYNGIPAYYYKSSQSVGDTAVSVNTDVSKYKVMLEPTRTNTRLGQYIEIIDADLGVIGVFLIEGVKVDRLYDASNNAIELNIKRI